MGPGVRLELEAGWKCGRLAAPMRRFALVSAFVAAAASGTLAMGAAPGRAAEACAGGDQGAQIACLNDKVNALEEKLEALTTSLNDKADKRDDELPGERPADDIVRYGSPIIIRNQDMRIFPRCLDNPGPDQPNMLAAVIASSCAPAAGQTWNLARPYK